MQSPSVAIQMKPPRQRPESKVLAPADAPQHQHKDDESVRCARCEAIVTTMEQRFDVNGSHAHYFVNPAGYDFNVLCFKDAPGCIGAGTTSREWTWFPNHDWQLAMCRHCSQHIGWLFRSKTQVFFGLIAERIIAP